MHKPIADLSYRNYTGDHLSSRFRWLVIAKRSWRAAFKKRAFWVFSILASWYYLVMIAFFFVIEQIGLANQAISNPSRILGQIVWKDHFLTGFTYSQPLWLVLGLMVGAGSIANDNGSNALLVYLSKPCRNIDYLVGKWMGVFVPLLVGMSVSNLFFYFYGLMNFRDYGFVSQDPALLLKIVAMILFAAAFQTSLLIGVSSFFNKGRMAGAAFSAAFFLLSFFSFLMFVAWAVGQGGRNKRNQNLELSRIAEKLNALSIDGLQIGLAKNILSTKGSGPFGAGRDMPQMNIPPPAMIFIPMTTLSILSVGLAWRRVRAVEVVK